MLNMNRRKFVVLAGVAWCAGTWKARASSEHPVPVAAHTAMDSFRAAEDEYRQVKTQYLPQTVDYATEEAPGTIIIDTDQRFLYFVLGPGVAKRYGVGVGRDGFAWSGTATIQRKAKWPKWYPPAEMRARDREARRWRFGMPGGPRNPLGARALYLYKGNADTLFRIHGTREPKTIGSAVSSGCIRMLNADVSEIFERVPIGAKVVVLASEQTLAKKRTPTRKQTAARKRGFAEASKRRRRKVQTAALEWRRPFRTLRRPQRRRRRFLFDFDIF